MSDHINKYEREDYPDIDGEPFNKPPLPGVITPPALSSSVDPVFLSGLAG